MRSNRSVDSDTLQLMEAAPSEFRLEAPNKLWHLWLFPLNTFAMLAWAEISSATPVLLLWFITLPVAMVVAAVPYLLFVVLPCRMLDARPALRIAGIISGCAAVVLLLVFGRHQLGRIHLSALGLALQLSVLPCALLYWLRWSEEKNKSRSSGWP